MEMEHEEERNLAGGRGAIISVPHRPTRWRPLPWCHPQGRNVVAGRTTILSVTQHESIVIALSGRDLGPSFLVKRIESTGNDDGSAAERPAFG